MSESLGLSIGVANLVAARAGSAPVTRSPVVTLFEQRPTEVGLPEENPNATGPGLVLRGFVERVGDRTPLVAADGTKYLGEVLTVEAIEAMARTVGYGTPVTIAIPAYWSEAQSTALREEFFAQPDLARGGVPPVLVPDATAALAALRTQPGFPTDGVVALCDFGASGTSVTLFDAGSNFRQIGPSVRNTDFSGDALDQLILGHTASPAATPDLASTARIGSQTRLLADCRRAKEQLSVTSVASVASVASAASAESTDGVRLSRAEFEQLISEPLNRFVGAVDDVLQRYGVGKSSLAAVAAVGGGASIPLVGARLSEHFGVPIQTSPQPAFTAAVGAAVLGDQQLSAGAPTAAGAVVETPTEMVGTARAAADPIVAWSEDADEAAEPVPYTGPDMTGQYGREPTKPGDAADDRYPAEPGGLPWYKRTALVLSVAAAAVAVLVALLLALTMGHGKTKPATTTTPNAPRPSQTVTITGPDDSTTVTVLPAPPPPSGQPPESSAAPPPPPPTTTNPPPTTTNPPSTNPPTTAEPTTSQPATTSQAPTRTAPSAPSRQRPQLPFFQPPFGH